MTTHSGGLEKLLTPAKLNGIELRNRLIKAATYEAMVDDYCNIDQRCIDFHERFAKGGVGMTTLAYCAPEADGRMEAHSMYIREEIAPQLKKLADTVHQYGTKLSGQISHCGGFSRNKDLKRKRPIAPSGGINMVGIPYGVYFMQGMDEALMKEVIDSYVRTAGIMKSSGFDALELHFGHGYLLSQFISPITNKRKDEYGGSIHNRMRFPLRVLEAVRKEVGNDFPLIAKITMYDDMKGGITLPDAIVCAGLLDKAGIDAIVLSAGTSSQNPMLLFHGDSLLDGLLKTEPKPLIRMGMRMVGKSMFKTYPYHDLYLMEAAKQFRDRVKCNLIYVGGATETESLAEVMNMGFDFVQSGRPLMRDPEMVRHLERLGENYVNGCDHCNTCATLIGDAGGIRCVLPEWSDKTAVEQ